MTVENVEQKVFPRADRFTSHALVEIRKFKNFPLFVKSAVLLDVSIGGFKAEFTGENRLVQGENIWLNIPLTPLGIYSPTRILIQGHVKWFDDKKYRVGGIFIDLADRDKIILEQVIDSLKKRGFLL